MAHRAENILRHLAPEECKAHELSGSSIHLKSNRDQAVIDRSKLKQLLAKEEKMFLDSHPKRFFISILPRFRIWKGARSPVFSRHSFIYMAYAANQLYKFPPFFFVVGVYFSTFLC